MAQEAKRGCGYRKVGGLYLSSEQQGTPCCKLPILLHICPTCNSGVKQTRGFQWLDPKPWLATLERYCAHGPHYAVRCPMNNPEMFGERVGLLWIGADYYPRPSDFSEEAQRLGVSRRIKAVPRGFKLGETWVWLAHPKVKRIVGEDDRDDQWIGGVFHVMRPTKLEKIVTESQSHNEVEMTKLREDGITPVVVPDDDKDHQGSVHDKRQLAMEDV